MPRFPEECLTERELRVLREVSAGGSYPQVARRLNISLRVVECAMQDVYDRIGRRTKAEAIEWWNLRGVALYAVKEQVCQ